jgi:hypothetical protein
VWDRLLAAVSKAYDGDIQMIDSSSIRVHQHAANGQIFSRVISYSRDDAVAALLPPLQSSDVATPLTAAAALAEVYRWGGG